MDISKVTSFGEKIQTNKGKDTHQWYEMNGQRVDCDEATIHCLWQQWIIMPDAHRYVEDGYLIFTFKKNDNANT